MVIWIIGKSGVGKTFFGKKVFNYLLKKKIKSFHIDGDEFRKFISPELGYKLKDRKVNGIRVQNLCKYFEYKDYIVIVSMQSAFPEMQIENKIIFKKYIQINIEPKSKKILKNKSNVKKIKKNIVGGDIEYKPIKGNLNLVNDYTNFEKNLKKIIAIINSNKTLI